MKPTRPQPGDFVRLPPDFTPDHQTDGLPGYPARDYFVRPGGLIVSGFYGRVRRISGRPCSLGGSPGGSYGRSVYVENAETGVERYVTHLDALAVSVGDHIAPGTILGTACDARLSGKPGTTHAHMGKRS